MVYMLSEKMQPIIDGVVRNLDTGLQSPFHIPLRYFSTGLQIRQATDLLREKAFQKLNCGLLIKSVRPLNTSVAVSFRVTRVE